MIALAFFLHALAAPTLGEVREMPAETATQTILSGKEHGPIVGIEELRTTHPLTFRGDVFLAEAPIITEERCTRTVWHAIFRTEPGDEINSAKKLVEVEPVTQIQLPKDGVCAHNSFSSLGNGLDSRKSEDITTGFRALALLHGLEKSTQPVDFYCKDSTQSNLCADPSTLAVELGHLEIWTINQTQGVFEFWLRAPKMVAVTTVRIDPESPHSVTVSRRYTNHFGYRVPIGRHIDAE